MLNNARKTVFIVCSHKDVRYLDRLDVHLAFYKRHGQLEVWDDRRLLPGAIRLEEVKKVLLCTGVAILLISADFLASESIATNELPALLAAAQLDGARILPVLLSPCGFPYSELAQFQAVNDPNRPLTKLSFHEKEEVWEKVAKTVAGVMNPIKC